MASRLSTGEILIIIDAEGNGNSRKVFMENFLAVKVRWLFFLIVAVHSCAVQAGANAFMPVSQDRSVKLGAEVSSFNTETQGYSTANFDNM